MFLDKSKSLAGCCPRMWMLGIVGGAIMLAASISGLLAHSPAAAADIINKGAEGQPPVPPAPPPLPPTTRPIAGPPGFGWSVANRLGVLAERPSETLVEQLGLPKNEGLVILSVPPGSAAAKAGLKSHDILLQLHGKAVPNNPYELDRAVRDVKPDQKVDAVVLRKGKKETIKDVTLPESRFAGLPGMRPPGMPGKFPPTPPFATTPPFARTPPFASAPGFGRPGHTTSVTTAVATSSNGVMTTLFKSNDRFTARHQEGSLIITVSGKTAGGKDEVKDISVQDGSVSNSYSSVSKVPERYRDKVKNLLEMTAGNNAKIDVREPVRTKASSEGAPDHN